MNTAIQLFRELNIFFDKFTGIIAFIAGIIVTYYFTNRRNKYEEFKLLCAGKGRLTILFHQLSDISSKRLHNLFWADQHKSSVSWDDDKIETDKKLYNDLLINTIGMLMEIEGYIIDRKSFNQQIIYLESFTFNSLIELFNEKIITLGKQKIEYEDQINISNEIIDLKLGQHIKEIRRLIDKSLDKKR